METWILSTRYYEPPGPPTRKKNTHRHQVRESESVRSGIEHDEWEQTEEVRGDESQIEISATPGAGE